jgi:hypothetical protein
MDDIALEIIHSDDVVYKIFFHLTLLFINSSKYRFFAAQIQSKL